jgi:pimeloyl-ACP methyl ester carboxylesterase
MMPVSLALWLEHVATLHDLDQVDFVGHSFGGGVAQMLLLECPERIRRIVLVAAGGLGRDVGFWLKLATFPHFVERYGQPFMAFGTRRAIGRAPHAQDTQGREDVAALSAMNSERGTARAFSRTVRDVINFGGQTRLFLQRAHEVETFPPFLVLWGERDTLIPIAHGRAFLERMQGAELRAFEHCGHYLHQEEAAVFVATVRAFLDNPQATPVRLLPAAVPKRRVPGLARKTLRALARRGRRAQIAERGLPDR